MPISDREIPDFYSNISVLHSIFKIGRQLNSSVVYTCIS